MRDRRSGAGAFLRPALRRTRGEIDAWRVYFALLIEEELFAFLSGVEPVGGDAGSLGGGVGGFDFGEAGGGEEGLVLARGAEDVEANCGADLYLPLCNVAGNHEGVAVEHAATRFENAKDIGEQYGAVGNMGEDVVGEDGVEGIGIVGELFVRSARRNRTWGIMPQGGPGGSSRTA